jgi:hypothetical protein
MHERNRKGCSNRRIRSYSIAVTRDHLGSNPLAHSTPGVRKANERESGDADLCQRTTSAKRSPFGSLAVTWRPSLTPTLRKQGCPRQRNQRIQRNLSLGRGSRLSGPGELHPTRFGVSVTREYSPKWHTATASALAGWGQKLSPGDVPPPVPRPPKNWHWPQLARCKFLQ